MKRKKPLAKLRSRNPFYRELRQLGAKVLKNMSGLHTHMYTPPTGPYAGITVSLCFYWLNRLYIIYIITFRISPSFLGYLVGSGPRFSSRAHTRDCE